MSRRDLVAVIASPCRAKPVAFVISALRAPPAAPSAPCLLARPEIAVAARIMMRTAIESAARRHRSEIRSVILSTGFLLHRDHLSNGLSITYVFRSWETNLNGGPRVSDNGHVHDKRAMQNFDSA